MSFIGELKWMLISALGVTLLSAVPVSAQQPVGGLARMSPQARQQELARIQPVKEALYQRIDVTAAQRRRLDAVDKKYLEQAIALVNDFRKRNSSPTPDQRSRHTSDLRRVSATAYKEWLSILTPAQREKVAGPTQAGSGKM
jgi:Spy/CpxP family protein refolding chaperone